MVRVLHIGRSMNRGGIETFIMNVYRTIDRSKIQFDFLLNMGNGDYVNEIEQLGGRVFVIPSRNKGFGQYRRNLDCFFQEHAVDYRAVHLHESSLSLIEPLLIAKKYGINIRIIHAHSTNQPGFVHTLLHWWHKCFLRNAATHYYACSERAKDWMFSYTGVLPKVQILKNGIIASDFKFNTEVRKQIREELHINNGIIVLGLVANLVPPKNHKFLIEIFKEFHSMKPESKLLLIGGGTLIEQTRLQIEQSGLTDSVLYLGKRNDISTLLQGMDAFVMPSLWEGLPVSLIEAQAAGLPVFCSDRISLMSKVTHNYYTLSLSQDAHDWAEFILKTLNSFHRKDTVNEILSAGFDIEETARKLCSVYIGK